jgi:hypothetical protein
MEENIPVEQEAMLCSLPVTQEWTLDDASLSCDDTHKTNKSLPASSVDGLQSNVPLAQSPMFQECKEEEEDIEKSRVHVVYDIETQEFILVQDNKQ